jgi:Tol biopolymer transport system component
MTRLTMVSMHPVRIAASALVVFLAACRPAATQPPAAVETAVPSVATASPTWTPVPPTATATATPRSPTRTPIIPHTATRTPSPTSSLKPVSATPPAYQSSAGKITPAGSSSADEIRSALAGLGRIAFFNGNGLSTIRPDGSDLRLVHNQYELIPFVSWSPDGRRLVYSSGTQIGIAEADGSGFWSITGSGPDNVPNMHPDWSPDGEWIAFISERSLREIPEPPIQGMRYGDLFIMRPDGTDARNLSPALPFHSSSPDWSPSGEWIAFRLDNQIYIVDSVTRGINPITTDANCENDNPSWSPDGEWIAFAGDCGGGWKLYMVSVENPAVIHEIRPWNTTTWSPDQPSWSPDGRFLAFENGRQIMVMDLPSLYAIAVTDGSAPAWSPAGVE